MENELEIKLTNDILSLLHKFRVENYDELRQDGQQASDAREILMDAQYDALYAAGEDLDERYERDIIACALRRERLRAILLNQGRTNANETSPLTITNK